MEARYQYDLDQSPVVKRLPVRGLQTQAATAGPLAAATTLTLGDSGGIWEITQSSAFAITLPSPTLGAGLKFKFVVTTAGAFNVTIAPAAGTFVGVIVNDVTSVIPCTGSTITIASGNAAVGDTIEIESLSTSKYAVKAITSTASGITIA